MSDNEITDIARALDQHFNGERTGAGRDMGFAIMVWPFGAGPGECEFASNCERASLISILREMATRLERGDA